MVLHLHNKVRPEKQPLLLSLIVSQDTRKKYLNDSTFKPRYVILTS